MIGVQDFIGYYDWTFEYLRRNFGEQAVRDYWVRAISLDSQTHARELIVGKGFDGMYEYWAHTLEMEEAGYTFDRGDDYFRIDMVDCPSKGHLIKRGLAAYHDYCEHCIGLDQAAHGRRRFRHQPRTQSRRPVLVGDAPGGGPPGGAAPGPRPQRCAEPAGLAAGAA